LLALLLADLALDAGQHRGQAAQPQRADQVVQAELRTGLGGWEAVPESRGVGHVEPAGGHRGF